MVRVVCQESYLLPSNAHSCTSNKCTSQNPHWAQVSEDADDEGKEQKTNYSFECEVREAWLKPAFLPQLLPQSTILLCGLGGQAFVAHHLSDVELGKSRIHARPMKGSKLVSCINASIRQNDGAAWMPWCKVRDIEHSPINNNPCIFR